MTENTKENILESSSENHHHHHHHDGCCSHLEPVVRNEPKIGRNDPCLCGSGKKFKKCCVNK